MHRRNCTPRLLVRRFTSSRRHYPVAAGNTPALYHRARGIGRDYASAWYTHSVCIFAIHLRGVVTGAPSALEKHHVQHNFHINLGIYLSIV